MLITPERVFYAGLLGRPRQRCPGAFHVYVAIEGGLRLSTADGRRSYGELVAVPPNVRHTIASDYRSAICIMIEPESVPDGAFENWAKRLSGHRTRVCSRAASAPPMQRLLQRQCRDDIASAEFDLMCFGEALPRRGRSIRAWRARSRRSNDFPASR